MFEFRLDKGTGVPAYRQLVDQVRTAIRLGIVLPGEQLPGVREVVRRLAINPNTVHKAYRELEQRGLVTARQGQGTFIHDSPKVPSVTAPADIQLATQELIDAARRSGLDNDSIKTLISMALEETPEETPGKTPAESPHARKAPQAPGPTPPEEVHSD